MTLIEAINNSNGRLIKLGDIELRIIDNKFYDRLMRHFSFTTIEHIKSDKWEIE